MTNNWEPTVGALTAERLDEIREYLTPPTEPNIQCIRPQVYAALLLDHADALTRQLDYARGIAVRLENEIAERDAYAAYPQRYVVPFEGSPPTDADHGRLAALPETDDAI